MESINVVINNYNDFTRISEEDEIVSLTEETGNQVQNDNVRLAVATQSVFDIAITSAIVPAVTTSSTIVPETDTFNIIDPVIRDPPTRIQNNHPTENIKIGRASCRERVCT